MRYYLPLRVALALGVCITPTLSHAQKSEVTKIENKPQVAVATKNITFETISETDKRIKSAIKADNLAMARKHIGKEATFLGTVAKVFTPKSNSVVVLNFAENYRTAVTAAILSKDFPAFPDLSALKGKRILITGKVVDYRGQPEMEVTKPELIKLVK